MSKGLSGLLTGIFFATVTYSEAQLRVGMHVGYATEFKALAGINGEFFLSQRISLSPSAVIYARQENDYGNWEQSTSYWELNADSHFYFIRDQSFYLLGGLTYVHKKTTLTGFEDYNNSLLGINLGLGANFGSKKVHPFFEIKYGGVYESQFIGITGVRFDLK
jgi:hypothetical protein